MSGGTLRLRRREPSRRYRVGVAGGGGRRTRWAVVLGAVGLVGLVTVVAAFGARAGDGDEERPGPADVAERSRPVGVLVPAAMVTAGQQGPLRLRGTTEDGTFQLRATSGDRSLTWVSQRGTQLGVDGLPLRCAGAKAKASGRTAKQATKVSGPAAHVSLLSEGSLLSVTAVSPSLERVNPTALPGLPATEIEGAILLSPEQALLLTEQPASSRRAIHSWSHRFESGLDVRAELTGSLRREVAYVFRVRADGMRLGASTDTLGLRCNDPSVVSFDTPKASYQFVLLNGGASLRVDGRRVTDTQDDPTVQGRWAVVVAPKQPGAAQAEIVDRSGKVLERWTAKYHPPEGD